jgi:hypothetical protein
MIYLFAVSRNFFAYIGLHAINLAVEQVMAFSDDLHLSENIF